MLKEVARYRCRGERGREFTVIERRHVISPRAISGHLEPALGTATLTTAAGQDVNELDDGSFQIVLTDEILRKI